MADTFGASGLCLLWVAFFETATVAWVYGKDRFYEDLFYMFGHKLDVRKGIYPMFGFIWKVTILYCNINSILSVKYVTPAICTATFAYALVKWEPTTYDNYEYPWWGEMIGICMAGSSILCIPFYLLIDFYRTEGNTYTEVNYCIKV